MRPAAACVHAPGSWAWPRKTPARPAARVSASTRTPATRSGQSAGSCSWPQSRTSTCSRAGRTARAALEGALPLGLKGVVQPNAPRRDAPLHAAHHQLHVHRDPHQLQRRRRRRGDAFDAFDAFDGSGSVGAPFVISAASVLVTSPPSAAAAAEEDDEEDEDNEVGAAGRAS